MIIKYLKTRASTLLELLIYFAILAVVLMVALTFAIQILNVSRLSGNFNELQTNMNFISEKMIFNIQSAQSIDLANSTFDNNIGALSLNMPSPSPTPIKFYISSGNIMYQEGTSTAVKLNSNDTEFITLRFHRVTYAKANDSITIEATFKPKNRQIVSLDKTVTIHLTVNLRR